MESKGSGRDATSHASTGVCSPFLGLSPAVMRYCGDSLAPGMMFFYAMSGKRQTAHCQARDGQAGFDDRATVSDTIHPSRTARPIRAWSVCLIISVMDFSSDAETSSDDGWSGISAG